jgi:hypothetical protein
MISPKTPTRPARGVPGGGAVAQLHTRLQTRQDTPWRLLDETYDGCTMSGVPLTRRPGGVNLVTLTIGGNDILQHMDCNPEDYRPEFEQAYRHLLGRIQKLGIHKSPDTGTVTDAIVVVGNIYAPDWGALSWAPFPADQAREILGHVNAFIAEKVRNFGFCLADIHGAFLGNEADYLCYAIEPTFKGASVIADLFEAAMNQSA